VGHIQLGRGIGSSIDEENVCVRHVAPLQRTKDAKMREKHEIGMILPARFQVRGILCSPLSEILTMLSQAKDPTAYDHDEMLRDHAFFTQPASATNAIDLGSHTASNARVEELEREVLALREKLSKAKGINDAMWEAVVRKSLTSASRGGEDDEGDGSRRRKKGKA
jgi:pre-rRNA-processing protein IPI3